MGALSDWLRSQPPEKALEFVMWGLAHLPVEPTYNEATHTYEWRDKVDGTLLRYEDATIYRLRTETPQ